MTTTWGRSPWRSSSAAAWAASPQRNLALWMWLRAAFSFAFSTAWGMISTPRSFLAPLAMERPMVPVPQYRSSSTSSPVRAAYSAAFS